MEDMRNKFEQHRKTEMEMAKEIFGWRYKDESAIDNYRFDNLFDKYISLHCPDIEKWIDTIFEKQQEVHKTYCDIDWGIDIIMNTPTKRVLFIDNYCTCADITQFLVIQDTIKDYKTTTHLRLVWNDEDTDYKGENRYISRPSFKWYKDRGFDLNFKEEWHMTELGGSYADCRDAGFLMTFSKEIDLEELSESIRKYRESRGDYNVEKGSLYRLGELKAKMWDLYGAWIELTKTV